MRTKIIQQTIEAFKCVAHCYVARSHITVAVVTPLSLAPLRPFGIQWTNASGTTTLRFVRSREKIAEFFVVLAAIDVEQMVLTR